MVPSALDDDSLGRVYSEKRKAPNPNAGDFDLSLSAVDSGRKEQI